MKNNSRLIILDTETTGLDPSQGDTIIEIAALEMIDNKITGNMFHQYYRPQKMIDITAENIHGLSIFDLIKKPEFNLETCQSLSEFIDNDDLVIHNAKFDLKFLEHHFGLFGLLFRDYYTNVIDTLVVAREKFPNMRNSLDALAERFKVNTINRTFHGALVDCEILGLVYNELIKDQQSLIKATSNSQDELHREKIVFERVNQNNAKHF